MPTLINGTPLFEVFASFKMGLPGTNAELRIKSGEEYLGQLPSMFDVDKIIPSKHMRIEIERKGGEEEVRVVNAFDGGYYSATGHTAIEITRELDARTVRLMGPPDLSLPVLRERYQPLWHCFIQYDHGGERILPTLHRMGNLTSVDEWRTRPRVPTSAVILDEDYCVVTDRRTGNFWVAEGELLSEIRRELDSIKCGVRTDNKQ